MASTTNLHNPRGSRRPASLNDTGDFPEPLRAVMALLVEPREMTYAALCERLLKEDVPQRAIDSALHSLVEQGYLESFMEGDDIIYMVRVTASGKFKSKTEEGRWDGFRYGLDALNQDEGD